MDAKAKSSKHEFDFIGGSLCLDFVNTWGGLPPESSSQERLRTYANLLSWTQAAELMNASELAGLQDKAETGQAEALAVLERACALRDAMREIFLALAKGTLPNASDLDLFNQELERSMAGARLMLTAEGYGWDWQKESAALDQMLAPIVRSAAMLLTSSERHLVRKCANEQCRWLFVDNTKNHRRQWCRADGCGNLMRVRKHRERQQSKGQAD